MPRVPEALMERLRQATNRFSEVRRRADDIDMADASDRAEVAAALRAADREFEELSREISVYLAFPAAPATGPQIPSNA